MFMPEMNSGTLYMGYKDDLDRLVKIGPVSECDIEPDMEKNDGVFIGIDLAESHDISFTAVIDPWVIWYMCTGRKFTNNWLKMHGGVRRRRAHLRK